MKISLADIKILWGKAGGRCSICDVTLSEEKGVASAAFPIGEHAHIIAEESNGPRGESPLSKKERNRYENLILLCPTCHTKVDKVPREYTVERLRELKSAHERRWAEASRTDRQIISPGAAGMDPSVSNVLARIRRIFSAHGLLPTHWERFFRATGAPFSINLQAMQSDQTLLQWLNEEKIQWIADTFQIRREWIDGEDTEVHYKYYFDKDPELFFSTIGRFTDALVWDKLPTLPEAYFIRCGRDAEWSGKAESQVVVVARIPMAQLSAECIVYKYISDLEEYSWDYGRTQIQLRAWARLLFVNKGMTCYGCDLPLERAREIFDNSVFLQDMIGSGGLRRHIWHPEDHALYPSESLIAKDTDSLPLVLDFLKKHRLPYAAGSLVPERHR